MKFNFTELVDRLDQSSDCLLDADDILVNMIDKKLYLTMNLEQVLSNIRVIREALFKLIPLEVKMMKVYETYLEETK